MTKIIGICGGSGSGKTTLANQLHQELKETSSLLAMDDYYKPIEEQLKDPNGIVNFDLPYSLDIPQFIQDLESLKSGAPISIHKYDFNATNMPKTLQTIIPNKYLITEGIFLLCEAKVVELLDYIIYVDASESQMLERRLIRDKQERDIEEYTVMYQWNNHFIPAYKTYVLPFKCHANLMVNGEEPNLAKLVSEHLGL
jgi:uridine kinase